MMSNEVLGLAVAEVIAGGEDWCSIQCIEMCKPAANDRNAKTPRRGLYGPRRGLSRPGLQVPGYARSPRFDSAESRT
jgi:hypothetical protein